MTYDEANLATMNAALDVIFPRPIRTVEVHADRRLSDEEIAAKFGVPFAGEAT